MESVRNKVVLITGASSGIGAGVAIEFAKYGSQLALTGRDRERLEAVGCQCEEQGLSKDKVLLITADLCKDEDVQKVVETTVARFGTIHVLVNNAAILSYGGTEDATMDQYDGVQRLNVRAVFYLTKLTIPYLKQNKGSIINMSSIAGLRADKANVAYCMSKAALDMFTRSLSLELAPYKVRVNSLNAGLFQTPIYANAGLSPEAVDNVFESTPRVIPLGRSGEISEVTQTTVYLASDMASYVTGTLMSVDGGLAQTTGWVALETEVQPLQFLSSSSQ